MTVFLILIPLALAGVGYFLYQKKSDGKRDVNVNLPTIGCENPDWLYYMNREGNQDLKHSYGHAKPIDLAEDLRLHWEEYGHQDRPNRGPCKG